MIEELDFRNQPLREIISALGRFATLPFLADETINESVSLYFADMNLRNALQHICQHEKLFVHEVEGAYVFSRINLSLLEDGTLRLDADNTPVDAIIRQLSRLSDRPVRWTSLPGGETDFHGIIPDIAEGIRAILAPWQEYQVTNNGSYVLISTPSTQFNSRDQWVIDWSDNLVRLSARNQRADDLLSAILSVLDGTFISYVENSPRIPFLETDYVNVNECISLILQSSGFSLLSREGLSVLVDSQSTTSPAIFDSARYYPLFLSCSGLAEKINDELGISISVRISAPGELMFTASQEILDEALELARRLDTPPAIRSEHYPLGLSTVAQLREKLPSGIAERLRPSDTGTVRSIEFEGSNAEHEILENTIRIIDQLPETDIYMPGHMSVSELVSSLPPGVDRSGIREFDNQIIIFGENHFRREISEFFRAHDRPREEWVFHILILQLQENARSRFSLELGAEIASDSSEINNALGLSQLLSLNFDVLSNLGYVFSSDLALDLSRAQASVLADTSIRGSAGTLITLDNTSTYRYREAGADQSGVVREIITGLRLQLRGDPLPENRIAIELNIELSKQGSDRGTAGSPPPTSSREITTRLVTDVGKVCQAADLQLEEVTHSRSGAFLGGSYDRTNETSQLLVFIFPARSNTLQRHQNPSEELMNSILPEYQEMYDLFSGT